MFLALLVRVASAADILVLDEDFDSYTTSSFSGTTAWVSGYSSDAWSTQTYGGVYAKTDESTGSWGGGDAVDNHLVYTGSSWDDFTFYATLYQGDDDTIGLVFRYQDASNFYVVLFPGGDAYPNTGSGARASSGTGTKLYKVVAGSASLVSSSTTSLTEGKTVDVKVVVSGTSIKVYADNNRNGSYGTGETLISTTDSAFSTGEVGLYCYDDGSTSAGCYFDDVLVYTPDTDSDGVADYDDNCPTTSNPSQDDLDGDGTGDACDADADGDGWAASSSVDPDCDDMDAAVYPGAAESCATTADDDCDGSTNDVGATGCTTRYADTDGDGYGTTASSCTCTATGSYTASLSTDCDDADALDNPAGTETCNGDDEDCDGTADDNAVDRGTWYADGDGDGYGDAGSSALGCSAPTGHVADATDCDDGDDTIHPGGEEWCDGADEDCDGTADEGALDATTSWADGDGDGYGDAGAATTECGVPTGNVLDDQDCDDGDAAVSPVGVEVCDDVDQDCNGVADDDAIDADAWYADGDGDGWGTAADVVDDCDAQPGRSLQSGDCVDGNSAIHPDATEICDGIDNDCSGASDDDAVDALVFYADTDGDGHGDPAVEVRACEEPDDASSLADDCDDGDETVYLGAAELPDALDNDCDGLADQGIDTDGDGLDDYTERTTWGSDPYVADTDGDGLADGAEVGGGTSPTNPDTDGGGASDGAEVLVDHTDPLDPGDDVRVDTDGDGLTDAEEELLGTDPENPDTDGGGAGDGDEVEAGTNPLDPADDLPGGDDDDLARVGGLYGGCGGAVPLMGLGLVAFGMRKRRSR